MAQWEQFLKLNEVIIQHPPFWDYDTRWFNYNSLLGMYAVAHYDSKVHGQARSIVPRSPGSGILVPCGHGQIFMAAQVWHGMSQALVLRHSSEQLAWQEQLEPVSSGLLVLQVQQMWVCMCGAGGGDAGCAAKKQCLVGACGVAVVPLGTVLAALTLHSQRCLHMWQYVEPLLVHTW